MELDENTFLIVNKKYDHARLAMWGTKSREMGTYEQKIHADQFWQLKQDPNHPGYYYIYNVKYEGYRVAKWGNGDQEVGSYNGQHFVDQLWKFIHVEGGYYQIYNLKYSNARFAKWGKGNGDWGTYAGDFYEDQVWKLVPRFKAEVSKATLWSCDNRNGSQDFSEEVTVTTGLKLTSSRSISTTVGLEQSLKASSSYAVASAEIQTKLSIQIKTSLSHTEEKGWSRQTKIKFTASKGKNYRVKQLTCDFKSPLADDGCALTCDYEVEETDGDFPN